MTHVEMQRWRSFFETSRADIWTVIHRAISVAALDYPKEFPEQRARIAETLFDRCLLREVHVKDDTDDYEDGEVRETSDDDGDVAVCRQLNGAADGDGDILACRQRYDDAEALSDELEEEVLILRDLNCIKETLQDADQPEGVILEALQRLKYMHITVESLKVTEVGKPVRSLKKHSSQRVRSIAKELMRQWKALIDEWIDSAKDVTAAMTTTAVATGTDGGDYPEDGIHGAGLLPPPLDEGALLAASAPVDWSQLFSFEDGSGDLCTEIKNGQIPSNFIEPSVRDNLSYSCRSQSESMLTEYSELDPKSSTHCPLIMTVAAVEERGSTTRDMHPPSGKLERERSASKGQASHRSKSQIDQGKNLGNDLGPGRPYPVNSKAKPVVSMARAKPAADNNSMSGSNMTMHTRNGDKVCAKATSTVDGNSMSWSDMATPTNNVDKKSGNNEVNKRLEIAKRKLHQGYEQAEKAKKQRSVQILDSSEPLNSSQTRQAKANTHVHSREHLSSGHAGKGKMNAPVHNRELMHSGQGGRAKMNAPLYKREPKYSDQGGKPKTSAPLQNKPGLQSGQWSQSRKLA